MIKILNKLLVLLFFSLMIFVFLSNPKLIMSSVNYSTEVFITNVLPSLFPFFILADFLINYNYVYFLNRIFKFKYSYLILLSLFSGLPSNAKYISSLLSNNEISKQDAEIMVSVTFFPNPMFVIGSVGVLMLGSVKLGALILISIYLSNFLVYLLYYRKLDRCNFNFTKEKKAFTSLIRDSIINNAKTLVVILGTIVIFTTLSNVIFDYIKVPDFLEAIITSIFEMTSGVKKMSVLSCTPQIKVIIMALALSFSGISVMCQAFSILSDYNLNIKTIVRNKLLVVLLTLVINYFYVIFFI